MIALVNANALSIPLADESCHLICTSPPYYALRDYKTNGQLGLEKRADCLGWATGQPCGECYICQMVAVFREVKRVLRSDGVCFLNIGDSYNSGSGGYDDKYIGGFVGREDIKTKVMKRARADETLKPKDMLLIPQRLALALQADGWWVRSEIIWHKPNPMPESVTDRPTKSHETIWLLAKSKSYFWDAEAVRENYLPQSIQRSQYASQHTGPRIGLHKPNHSDKRDPDAPNGTALNPAGRNLRDVWTIATQPYSGAHYATYPEALVERCIKAGTSERGVCPKCGSQWEREIEKAGGTIGKGWTDHKGDMTQGMSQLGCSGLGEKDNGNGKYRVTTLGFRSSCSCGLDPIPATVLDPFAGSGTTCLVAKRMGRSAIGLDLSYQYLRENAWQRVQMNAPVLL